MKDKEIAEERNKMQTQRSIERLTKRAKSFVKANKERLKHRAEQITGDITGGYFAIASSLILSGELPKIIYGDASYGDFSASLFGVGISLLSVPFFYMSKKSSEDAFSPKKITLPRLGLSFYADKIDEFHDDGIVESIPKRLEEVDLVYGTSSEGEYTSYSSAIGIHCPRTNNEGGKVSRIFYLDDPYLQNTLLHEEIHALDRFGRMDRLEDKLEEENGVVLRGLQNIQNPEIQAELSTQLKRNSSFNMHRSIGNQAYVIAYEIIRKGDGRKMNELYVETEEGFVPVTSEKLGSECKIPNISPSPRVYTREEVDRLQYATEASN